MNEQPEDDTTESSGDPAPKSGVDQGRRRLGRLGASGTAVVLSVTSRSAVAGWGMCTGSELASGNLSRAGTANPCGCSPGFWWNTNGMALWTSTPTLYINYPPTAVFNTVFGVQFYTEPNIQLKDVGPSTKHPNIYGANDNTGMQAVAALLNAQYYGSRYPVMNMHTAAAVIAAFQTAFRSIDPVSALRNFVTTVDIYGKVNNLWCNGTPE